MKNIKELWTKEDEIAATLEYLNKHFINEYGENYKELKDDKIDHAYEAFKKYLICEVEIMDSEGVFPY
jgi:hypothetical protein